MDYKFAIKDMNLHYGEFHALKNINLNIRKNEVTAFIGPSGCGKSTLLKSLNRMNDLVEGCRIDGEVLLDGEDIFSKTMDVNILRKRVGMVFQKANPFPMSIYDNIAYGPRTHGIKNKTQLDQIVEESLRDAAIWDELKDRLKKSALGLSGGQQQRLCIARALAVKPEVLLMDEPTSALDVAVQRQVVQEMLHVRELFGTAIIIVTHDIGVVSAMADTVLVLQNGNKMEYGPVKEVLEHPQNVYTKELLSAVPKLRRSQN